MMLDQRQLDKAIRRLNSVIGKEKVFTEEYYLSLYSFDSTKIFFKPDAVIFPESEIDVVRIAQVASEYKIPIVARGSGTSRSGGPLPICGGFVICFARMNKIKEIDRINMVAVVEPGVITQELNNEVAKYGLYYPPDPSSVKVSTIGGNISHNAGGIHAVKYGVTKNYLLGLRVVTVDGRVLRLGGKVLKSVVGYDIMRLIAGSEGTLALITEAILRLIPKPQTRVLFVIPFFEEYGWIDVLLKIYESGVLPCSIEFMDKECISVNRRAREFSELKKEDIQSIVFIELDGQPESVLSESKKVKEILSSFNITDVIFSDDVHEIEDIWDIRRDVSPSLNLLGGYKIADDISVPLSSLRDTVHELRRFAHENSFRIAIFGHAGDSNLHVNFIFGSKEEMEKNFEKIMKSITDIVVRYGGSISGEHGVGFLKKGYSEEELDTNALEVMKQLKRLFDPHNLLNPMKIFKDC
ncbi:MAG: FAD-binding oxidoreductase [Deltaproteobacteria bacterium]|nr:FAD-binding oxidoreductase [Deltaproteobacteria bacterium]